VRIGIDVGGTKIEGLLLSDSGDELGRIRVATPRGDYDATVAAIADVVRDLERPADCQATVGLGTPGSIDPSTGVIKGSNSVALNGRSLAADVGTALGREARIANDADCLALSEAIDGAAAGSQNVFAAILGTGVGGGVVIHGRLAGGPNAIAGEWGHNPLPWPRTDETPGPYCYCGRRGCIERWLSGPALERQYAEVAGVEADGAEIAAAIEAGEPAGTATLGVFADRAARAFASIINVLDPEVIVLGGGVSNIGALYTAIPSLWDRYVFSDTVVTSLVPAVHGDSSGVRGAAWLWPA
jgi:fructokinase